MRRRAWRGAVGAVMILAAATTAADARGAESEAPASGLTYLNLTALRLNPLGLQNQFDLDW